MTAIPINRYFFNRAFYRLRTSQRLDNPDQRISEDVQAFTTGVLGWGKDFAGHVWVSTGLRVGFFHAPIHTRQKEIVRIALSCDCAWPTSTGVRSENGHAYRGRFPCKFSGKEQALDRRDRIR
jgi:hypothetical protein